MRILLSLLTVLSVSFPVVGQDLVAKTDAQTPEKERESFQLPKGFEAQLIASEPDIQKPMQMAFDTLGRLWVTTSYIYPFPVEPGKGTDRLYVLSDFDEKGQAKKITVFDDQLNIPIGVLPLDDGKSVIVSECGKILKLTDTDGDGKADQREDLYTGFGYKDTHGMTNSFTLMPDGWIYACHGFANHSKVQGKDGHEVTMHSGHTFRFKADGSRIEVFTMGQVNPFGIAVDPWGNLYTACCHSKPITQLIRGSYYDSFGKPHDGLGYGPHVVNHQHGSTGLCGLVYYNHTHFPKEYRDVLFLGNVVTSRINLDRVEWNGSTPVGKELPDFLVSKDPWFRPVDLKQGPDGALYISDFYNKIIGHYEVDLKHPGRDKIHGRLWRIVWTGKNDDNPLTAPADLSALLEIKKLANLTSLSCECRATTISALKKEPRIARIAADVITAHPHQEFIPELMSIYPHIDKADTHLKHACKIALRNCIASEGGFATLQFVLDTPPKPALPVEMIRAIKTMEAAAFLVQSGNTEPATYEHIGQYGSPATHEKVLQLLGDNTDAKASVTGLAFYLRGLKSKNAAVPEVAKTLANEMCASTLRSEDISAITVAYELVNTLQLREQLDTLTTIAKSGQKPEALRIGAMRCLANLDFTNTQALFQSTLLGPTETLTLKSQLAQTLGERGDPVSQKFFAETIAIAPEKLASVMAMALTKTPQGADTLLQVVGSGKVPASLLTNRAVSAAPSMKDANRQKLLAELTKNLPSPDAKLLKLIQARSAGFQKAKVDLAKGQQVFTKSCAICHQLNNEGAKVGPQLDGVGIRGVERLLEDTLDPNRNVDHTFRATILNLLDGRSLTGLLREDSGDVLILVDAEGKEQRIAKGDVDKQVTTTTSAMPANIEESIAEEDYYHLLGYLLEQKPK